MLKYEFCTKKLFKQTLKIACFSYYFNKITIVLHKKSCKSAFFFTQLSNSMMEKMKNRCIFAFWI